MSKPYQIGVRLTDEQREALEKIAEKTKQDLAKLIRYAVDALIEHYDRCGGRLVLPIDFTEVIRIIKQTEQDASSTDASGGTKKSKAA